MTILGWIYVAGIFVGAVLALLYLTQDVGWPETLTDWVVATFAFMGLLLAMVFWPVWAVLFGFGLSLWALSHLRWGK